MRTGIDFAWHPALDFMGVKSLGHTFVCRYLSPSVGKNLSPSEAATWRHAGLDIVSVWESTATRAESGYAAGVQDAHRAVGQALSCGAGPDSPHYFAVDEDTTVGPHIRGYFSGVASVIPLHLIGGYGGLDVIRGLFDQNLVSYGWQTYAWSGSPTVWDPRAHLRQVQNGINVCGIASDLNHATAPDFGQWRYATPHPAPAPAPHPAPPSPPVPPVHPAVHNPYPRPNFERNDIRRFSIGDQVKWVQWALGIRDTGIFDLNTDNHVRNMQRHYRFTPDGIVGRVTGARLATFTH